ncbi:MAG: VCBS repeat-containing protein, partial [Bacteroidota bacterium]
TQISSSESGIDFVNQLEYDKAFNIYTYRNFYNGGGVAIGDVNKDGLMDVYFTANMKSNKLYLNKGNFKFEDVTEQAGVGGNSAWSTGVTMADVNGDGYLDIYVCNSGDVAGDNKQNELFINQGGDGLTFTEEAAKYGIADQGYGTHASFFDYDKDGDLDLYLLNNSYRSIFDFNLKVDQRPIRDEKGGDKFFRNDEGNFTDISEEAGIYGSEIGFGLGVTVGDVNRDGWLDIFVSNDFFEKDYLYINQKDGTFLEDLENQILSLSVASMGADMADINNDGYPEIFVTEMLPEGDARFKTKMTFENWDRYQYGVKNGYYHQFTRNVLQLNNGDGSFSEIGRLAGIEATDWSWGALMADYDNDGLKDLYVVNGLNKDIIDQDYINFVSNEEVVRQMRTPEGVNFKKLIDTIPSTRISNYLFKNQGDLQFENVADAWGLATPSHSNGSAYADFDNDGDLDLVVNNVNMESFLYRNESEKIYPERHYLKVELEGTGKNPYAIGANVNLKAGDKNFYIENIPIRGFQSSIDYRPNFGLGDITKVDELKVEWPSGEQTILKDVAVDQMLTIKYTDADKSSASPQGLKAGGTPLFTEIKDSLDWRYEHKENLFVDFKRDLLLYHMMSTEGPHIAKADVNGDGLEDFFIGGAANSAGAMYEQQRDGSFLPTNEALFNQDRASEDMDCIFFDADNDGDQDLYVARGGNEFLIKSNVLVDQLYLNDGSGKFSRSPQYLPTFKPESSACVQAADYDKDGDMDLFVGIRAIPGYYGVSANGYLLNNNGKGVFKNVTKIAAPELENLGMIKDIIWMDFDGDEDEDMIVSGEWMPISFFENNGGKFRQIDAISNADKSSGWWNCMQAGDFDKDGDLDLIVGNHGLNSRFTASPEKPITVHVKDFDNNGTPDPVISQYNGEESYPIVLRHDLTMQLPALKRKYLKYINYKEQKIEDIFSPEQLEGTLVKEVHNLKSSLLINNGDGSFELRDLPLEAQYSPVYGLLVEDFDKDGNLDVLLGGNLYAVKPEVGRYDANYGLFLKGKGDGSFESIPSVESGFFLKGEVRDLVSLKNGNKSLLLVAKNNEAMQLFTY